MKRLQELDFLRGIAIILVLLRHRYLFQVTANMGWIGVDLFFVLSGFLVSGLLFKEYIKYKDFQPVRFLVRRGFKIYPIYYFFYIPYLLRILTKSQLQVPPMMADLVFFQNYYNGVGYAYPASWSLAVEEHFYFVLCFFFWLCVRLKGYYADKGQLFLDKRTFQWVIFFSVVLCLIVRILTNVTPGDMERNFTMSHLRMDSLFAGVYVSFLYYFRKEKMLRFFQRFRLWLLLVAVLGIVWTPFIEPVGSFFVKTIGFSFLYVSFSILLMYCLLTPGINSILISFFTRRGVEMVSQIGYCSYSIYVIHTIINYGYDDLASAYALKLSQTTVFFLTSTASVCIGMLMTHFIESYFLRLRNKIVPSLT